MAGYIADRGDCNGESAAALALSAKALGDPQAAQVRERLGLLVQQVRPRDHEWGNPEHGAYGLIAWSLGSPANYGDDNARLLLGTMAASRLLGTDNYDRPMMMCLLAQLRTTGKLGFRGDCLYLKQLGREGWQHYFDRKEFVNYSPHMEAYLWACFLSAWSGPATTCFTNGRKTQLHGDHASITRRLAMDQWPRPSAPA